MFQVGEDCEVMIRVDEDSEEEDFQLVSGLLTKVPSLGQVKIVLPLKIDNFWMTASGRQMIM